MINFDIDVDSTKEAEQVRNWLFEVGMPFKPNSLTVYNKETQTTQFYKAAESEIYLDEYYIYSEVEDEVKI